MQGGSGCARGAAKSDQRGRPHHHHLAGSLLLSCPERCRAGEGWGSPGLAAPVSLGEGQVRAASPTESERESKHHPGPQFLLFAMEVCGAGALSWSQTKDVLFPEKWMRPLARECNA